MMDSFEDFYNKTKTAVKNNEVYDIITSPEHISYFLTIKSDMGLFSDEVKVILADNKIDINEVNIKTLYTKFNKEYK